MKKEKGFSIIETMVTVSIIALLAVITLGAIRSNQDKESLNSSTQKMIAQLRLQQARSSGVTRVESPGSPSQLPPVFGFGIRAIDPSTYFIYQDFDSTFSYSAPSEIIQIETLPPQTFFNFKKMPGTKDVCFIPPGGKISRNQSYKIYLTAGNEEDLIKIDPSGNISYE